jgi:MoaA/NifB/PqqE/SkfB family radical SAM enzyme
MVVQETPEGLLLRPSDPPLSKVYIEPTSECNLRCLTCVRNTWDDPLGSMSVDIYRKLISGLENVLTLKVMSFWGIGEPLMHPDIVEMVGMASRLKAKTEVITNGMLLNKETAEGLVESGLDTIIISIDGPGLG